MFKFVAKKIILFLLRQEARLVIRKYRPKIIGVTGSVGKTSAKEAIGLVLTRANFKVRISPKSFNSELGVPLTILDCANAWYNPLGWLKNLLEGLSLIVFRSRYPEWLVLEIGADRPGDISAFTSWLPFTGAVLTALPESPVHLEFFPSVQSLWKEKWQLARVIPADGFVVINADDPQLHQAAAALACRVYPYGFNEATLVQATDLHPLLERLDGVMTFSGLSFKIAHAGHVIPVQAKQLVGRHQVYSLLAAAAVGLALGIDWLTIAEALGEFTPPPGRLRLIAGINGSWIIDDSYNASPAAVSAALATLAEFPTASRRILILGDMLELGDQAIEAHRQIGNEAGRSYDFVWTVGVRMQFLAEMAAQKRRAKNRVRHFADAGSLAQSLRPLLKPGDVVLVKGSQAMRLERVVAEVMAHPEDKKKLLARQEPEWQKL